MATTTPAPGTEADRNTALARSLVYAFLARVLAFPTSVRLAELRDRVGPAVAAVTAGDGGLGPLAREALAALDAPGASLRRGHTLAFPPIESREHPTYESAYASGDVFAQSDVMADVAGFYRAHGLAPGGRERERPDHIAAELEFMGFMARKEAVALGELGPAEVAECRRTQAHFLRDHLGCWAPAFGERLAASAPGELYPRVGRLVRAWTEAEMAALDVVPARALGAPFPPPPPDDETCGVDAGGVPAPHGDLASTPVATPRRRTGP